MVSLGDMWKGFCQEFCDGIPPNWTWDDRMTVGDMHFARCTLLQRAASSSVVLVGSLETARLLYRMADELAVADPRTYPAPLYPPPLAEFRATARRQRPKRGGPNADA